MKRARIPSKIENKLYLSFNNLKWEIKNCKSIKIVFGWHRRNLHPRSPVKESFKIIKKVESL
jgi:hypothetical protein